MSNTLHSVITKARAILAERHPRAAYADNVLMGRQAWSGADIKGKARRYGGHYAQQRARAATALADSGGLILAIDKGKLVSAAPACVDDYGNAVMSTRQGLAWPNTAAQYKLAS